MKDYVFPSKPLANSKSIVQGMSFQRLKKRAQWVAGEVSEM